MSGQTFWGGTVTLATANHPYSVFELVDALTGADNPNLEMSSAVSFLSLQPNPSGTGDYYVGTARLRSSFAGVKIAAGQYWPPWQMFANSVQLKNVFIMSTVAGDTFNVSFVQK